MTIAGSPYRRRSAQRLARVALARRDHRDGQARVADRADAARPGRDDDHRSGADRPSRRHRHRRGRAGANRAVCRLRARHGHCLGGGAAGGAGLRRARAAHGAPRAARRPVGRGAARRADDGAAVSGRRHPAGARPERRDRALAGRYLWPRLVPDAGLVVHRAARLHGRGQPAGAGAVDHAGRDPDQRAARLCADLWRVRLSRTRSARRRRRHHARQHRHVHRRLCGLLCAAAVQEISACSAASGAWTGR